MTVVLEDIFRSKTNFENAMVNSSLPISIAEIMQQYPKKTITRIADLTQNMETLLNVTGQKNCQLNQYLVWIITNEKEKIMNTLSLFNDSNNGKFEIFVFKASLNGKKIDFECLLKPELKEKRVKNNNTPTKRLQKNYWKLYITECDMSENPDMQIKESAPQHYQNVSIGKYGLQILQTINTQENYVASEIAINNNKDLFYKFLEHKEAIEKELGKLQWVSKETNKSAKIRKVYPIDVNNLENYKKAIQEQIKMGAELKAIAYKYL